jgi:hypothetical protein
MTISVKDTSIIIVVHVITIARYKQLRRITFCCVATISTNLMTNNYSFFGERSSKISLSAPHRECVLSTFTCFNLGHCSDNQLPQRCRFAGCDGGVVDGSDECLKRGERIWRAFLFKHLCDQWPTSNSCYRCVKISYSNRYLFGRIPCDALVPHKCSVAIAEHNPISEMCKRRGRCARSYDSDRPTRSGDGAYNCTSNINGRDRTILKLRRKSLPCSLERDNRR